MRMTRRTTVQWNLADPIEGETGVPGWRGVNRSDRERPAMNGLCCLICIAALTASPAADGLRAGVSKVNGGLLTETSLVL